MLSRMMFLMSEFLSYFSSYIPFRLLKETAITADSFSAILSSPSTKTAYSTLEPLPIGR